LAIVTKIIYKKKVHSREIANEILPPMFRLRLFKYA